MGRGKVIFPDTPKLEPWFCTLCACVSLRGLDENGLKFYENEESTWKACQTTIFHRQICKFVTILLPSLSCIRTLPNFFLVHRCFAFSRSTPKYMPLVKHNCVCGV